MAAFVGRIITAAVAPTVNNDSSQGMQQGYCWYDSVGKVFYICADPGTTGNALWVAMTGVAVTGTLTLGGITSGASTLPIAGLAAAQGGSVSVTGGTSSTAGNLGGAVTITGGTPGSTSVGGALALAAGAGGSASGNGAVASLTGGAGTAGNATGGIAKLVGGAGQGSANGGAAQVTGGAAGATGTGGQVTITGGAATAGVGGAVVIAGAAGVGSNKAGGLVSLTGGAAAGAAIGGVASLVGGAGGAGGATGKGGAALVTGGATTATNADGGGAVVAGGAPNGSGFVGPVVLGNAQLTPVWYPQAAPATDGADTPFTATVAQMVAGLISMTPTTGRTITLPTGTQMDAGVAFADVPATFGFDFSVQNRAAFATSAAIITIAAGASGMTVTGSALVSPGSTARFRAVRTTTATWIIYKIAG